MISDDERREAARRLRESNVRREFYSPWCKMVESVLDGTDCGEDDGTCDENACCERFMKRMADLIEPEPERTCRFDIVENGTVYAVWKCNACGFEISENKTDAGTNVFDPCYCPNCGAKVVSK